MNREKLIVKYKIPEKRKGLVLKVSIDTEYGGFYWNLSKYRLEVCMGYMALRIFFMSEAEYDFLQSYVTMSKSCTTHDIKVANNEE